MIRRKTIKQRNLTQLDNKLRGLTLYSVASIIDNAVRYVADYDEFGIIKEGEMVICSLDEVPELASMCVPKIREEILAIYQDLQDLTRMEINWVFKYRSDRVEAER